MNQIQKPIFLLFSFALLATTGCSGQVKNKERPQTINGFELSNLIIPSEEIFHGGPPRDGIPSIDNPQFDTAESADFIKDEDYVLGVSKNEVAKAYPIRILNYHEIVNDMFGDAPVAITYCPLQSTSVTLCRKIGLNKYVFSFTIYMSSQCK